MAKIGESSTFQDLINLIKSKLGSAAYKNAPAGGNAGNDEVVLGNDSRLTDARTPVSHKHNKADINDFPQSMPASDVYSWAKAENKPSYDYSEIENTPNIPTKVSDLSNDSGFISTETDPTVPSWAKAESKPSYDYSEIENTPNIPTKVSDLTNDSGFLTAETDPTVPAWAKAENKPSYNYSEINNTPNIPTKISDLTNDSGFLTTETDPTVPSWAKSPSKPSYEYSEIGNKPTLGTASTKDVAASGNASVTQVVMGNDSRLTDSRNAKDVPAWAKAENKPSYDYSEITNTPNAYDTNPEMNGAASAGVSDDYARGDHVHPSDTSKITKSTPAISNNSPYLFKKSGSVGLERLKDIVGASYVNNQLVRNGNFANENNWTVRSNSVVVMDSNVATVTPNSANTLNLIQIVVNNRIDHKILVSADVKSSSKIRITMQNNAVRFSKESLQSGNWERIQGIYRSREANETLCFSNTTDTSAYDIKNVIVIDLTQLFGSADIADYIYSLETATAGAGIAKLKELGFDFSAYRAYDAGTIVSVNTSGIKCVGKNLAYLVQGTLNVSTGAWTSSDTRVVTDFIRVEPNQTYKASTNGWSVRNGCYYDRNKQFLFGNQQSCYPNPSTDILTVPNNDAIAYVRIIYSHSNTSENCSPSDYWYQLEIGDVTTPYEPYTEKTTPLSPIDLRGLYKLNVVVGKNLFDGIYPNISDTTQYRAIYVGDGTFTMSTTAPLNSTQTASLFFLEGNVQSGASTRANGVDWGTSRTVQSVDGYVTIAYKNYGGVNPQNYKTQIEKGSSATAFEPYGIDSTLYADGDTYKSDGSVSENYGIIDLSTVNSWSSGAVNSTTNMIRFNVAISDKAYGQNMLCNRFLSKGSVGYDSDNYESISGSDGSNRIYIVISASKLNGDLSTEANRSTAFKSWIASNSTSVIYPLATPTAGTAKPYPEYINIYQGGTEEFIDTRALSAPVGHDSDLFEVNAESIIGTGIIKDGEGNILSNKQDKVLTNNIVVIEEECKTVEETLASLADAVTNPVKSVQGNPIIVEDVYPSVAVSLKAEFEPIQNGSGDPTPTNIRDISGLIDTMVLTRGKNMYDKTRSFLEYNYYIDANNQLASWNVAKTIIIPCSPNTKYTISKVSSARFACGYLTGAIEEGAAVYGLVTDYTATSITVTTNENAKYLVAFVYNANADTLTFDAIKDSLQIEMGSVATPYEAYRSSYSYMSFDNPVYGGTIDFKTGKVIITKAYVYIAADIISAVTAEGSLMRCQLIDSFYNLSYPSGISNMFTVETSYNAVGAHDHSIALNASNGNQFLLHENSITKDKASLQEFLTNNPIQICYDLVTPVELQLTPSELQMLDGYNYITGDDNTYLHLSYCSEIAKSIWDGVLAVVSNVISQ